MQITSVELLFSEVTRTEDGAKASETSIMETLVIEWDDTRKKFKASAEGQSGYGHGRTDAVLDYLRVRLGLGAKPSKVHYSSRVY